MRWWKRRRLAAKDAGTRLAAAIDLAKAGDESGLAVLVADGILSAVPAVRLEACHALGRLGSAAAATLIVALKHPDGIIRAVAARYLRPPSSGAIAPLVAALDDPFSLDKPSGECFSVSRSAAHSLGQFGADAHAALKGALLSSTREHAALADALRTAGFEPRGVEETVKLAIVDGTLGRIDVTADMVAAIARAYEQGDDATRLKAVLAMGNVNTAAAIPHLAAATTDSSSRIRLHALYCLRNQADKHVYDEATLRRIAACRDDRDAEAQEIARALYASLVPRADSREEIRAALDRRWQVVAALGRPAVGALVGLLADPNAGIRERAARALGAIEERSAAEPLRSALRDPMVNVRAAAAEALVACGAGAEERDALTALLASAVDEPAEFFTAAIRWLPLAEIETAAHARSAAGDDAESDCTIYEERGFCLDGQPNRETGSEETWLLESNRLLIVKTVHLHKFASAGASAYDWRTETKLVDWNQLAGRRKDMIARVRRELGVIAMPLSGRNDL